MAGAPGLNAVTGPLAARPGRVVRAPGVHFRPETGGRVMISAPAIDAALADAASVPELAGRLVRAAAEHFPALADAPLEDVRVARRAMPPDGLPVVGRLDTAPWLYHAVTHSGVTLAPLLGKLVADELVDDRDAPRLASYRPGRLVVG
jgi:glycine/D-amino acid oxidase-like deaminating enzyme